MHFCRCKGQAHGGRRGQRKRCTQIAFWESPKKTRRYRWLAEVLAPGKTGHVTVWSPGLQTMSNKQIIEFPLKLSKQVVGGVRERADEGIN